MRVESSGIEWFRKQVIAWTKRNFRDYPWRKTSDPYSILIAEFLLQSTDADKVVPIYEVFRALSYIRKFSDC